MLARDAIHGMAKRKAIVIGYTAATGKTHGEDEANTLLQAGWLVESVNPMNPIPAGGGSNTGGGSSVLLILRERSTGEI